MGVRTLRTFSLRAYLCLGRGIVPYLRLLALALSIAAPLTVAAEQPFAKRNQSHFAQVLSTTVKIPRGANAEAVRDLLETKWLLRKDLPGVPIAAENDLSELHFARDLPPNSILVEGAVVPGFPGTLTEIAPPTRSLVTVRGKSKNLAATALCKHYESATVSFTEPESSENEGVLTTDAKIVGHALGEEQSIVVLSLRPSDAEAVRSRPGNSLFISCLERDKYE